MNVINIECYVFSPFILLIMFSVLSSLVSLSAQLGAAHSISSHFQPTRATNLLFSEYRVSDGNVNIH